MQIVTVTDIHVWNFGKKNTLMLTILWCFVLGSAELGEERTRDKYGKIQGNRTKKGALVIIIKFAVDHRVLRNSVKRCFSFIFTLLQYTTN